MADDRRELLATALAAADAAAAYLADARPVEIRGKSTPRDLVTEHDLASEALIRRILAERTPDLPIVGEEGGADPRAATAARRWLVDPIDGTVNFAHGFPMWSVTIAVEDASGPEVGVVVAPRVGWRFWAVRGGGAFAGPDAAPVRLATSACDRLDHALLATGFPPDRATNPDNNLAEWAHLKRHATVRRVGCASLDLCFVASGWFDGYWERRLRPWDLAAGALLVEEAGGRVTDTRGGPFRAASGEIVATGGGIHDALIAHLAQVAEARQI